jgi:hypothetical protein
MQATEIEKILALEEKGIKKALKIFKAGVVMSGFEPPTHGFSVRCSTN